MGIPSHIYGRDPARVALMVAGTETQTRGGLGHGEACGPEVASRPPMHMLKADETFPLAGFEAQVRRRQLCGRIGSRLEWNLPHPVV